MIQFSFGLSSILLIFFLKNWMNWLKFRVVETKKLMFDSESFSGRLAPVIQFYRVLWSVGGVGASGATKVTCRASLIDNGFFVSLYRSRPGLNNPLQPSNRTRPIQCRFRWLSRFDWFDIRFQIIWPVAIHQSEAFHLNEWNAIRWQWVNLSPVWFRLWPSDEIDWTIFEFNVGGVDGPTRPHERDRLTHFSLFYRVDFF